MTSKRDVTYFKRNRDGAEQHERVAVPHINMQLVRGDIGEKTAVLAQVQVDRIDVVPDLQAGWTYKTSTSDE